MRLLFIKLKHIGDVLLMTPALTAAREAHLDAEIWVVVRRGCEGILAGCPAIDRLLVAPAAEKGNRKVSTWRESFRMYSELRRQKFDYVFELGDGERGRWLSVLTRAKHRCANGGGHSLAWFWRLFFDQISTFSWLGMHTAEKDYRTVAEALSLPEAIPPLTFDRERMRVWEPAAEWEEFAFLNPATRWLRKQWPQEDWLALGKALLERVPRLVVSCGPAPEEIEATRNLCEQLGENASFTGGQLDWSEVAWLMSRAKLFVGVDTAAMHLAAACQCPTVAIFGPSVPWIWRPWKVRHRLVSPERHDDYSGEKDQFKRIAELKISDVSVEQVLAACDALLSKGREDGTESAEVQRESNGTRKEP